MRTPNVEQKTAIELWGGVLSAGAGSGKTFVLIEHTINKVLKIAKELFESDQANWKELFHIRTSKIALLTFTKKAAAEMRSRLAHSISNRELPSYLDPIILNETINGIFVGTIHSFLLKMIKDGVLEGFESIEITSTRKFKREIGNLVDQGILSLEYDVSQEVYQSFLSNVDHIKTSFTHIFNDAELRIFWEKFELKNVEAGFWRQLYTLCEIDDLLNLKISLDSYQSDSSKVWFQAIVRFMELQHEFSSQSFEDHFVNLTNFFSEFKRITPPRKPEYAPVLKVLNKIKVLRGTIKSNHDHLSLSIDKNKEMNEFYLVLKKLFNFVDYKIQRKKTITFSTLEYYFSKLELDKPPLEYLLVDEFQDTSWAQHGIIEKIVNGGWENIFVVGDKKQAIYRFRGGEVDVFDKTISKSKNVLDLINNYRSHRKVVDFNNDFFSTIFPLGLGFEEKKAFSVNMENQKPQVEDDHSSKVENLCVVVNQEKAKLASIDLERIEADLICSKIESLVNLGERDIAILYPRLKPSYFLIKNLIKGNYSFVSQSKLNTLDQPIITILLIALENAMGFYQSESIANDKISQILSVLGIESQFLVSGLRLRQNVDYFGIEYALLSEIHLVSCTITDKDSTINLISEVCADSDNSIEKFWLLLKEYEKENFSVELINSSDSMAKIKIMSVHSSKGLEFDNVLLGGIHTNGGVIKSDGILKKYPGSFKWRPDVSSKKLAQSPNFILESLEDKILDFNEQKRLLYVACTRAKKALFFPRIIDVETGSVVSKNKNSWVNAISLVSDKLPILEITLESSNINFKRRLPFFHIDNLGYKEREIKKNHLKLSADQSVTGLSELFFCPRKYYLSNICKYDDSTIKFLNEIYADFVPEQYKKFITHSDNDEPKSSKKRGSQLHSYIEGFIKGSNVENLKGADKVALNYCFSLLKGISKKYELLSEYSIKFKFNGQFINGVCDLVLLSEERDYAEIWDFKTGKKDLLNQNRYEAQLKLYAAGILNLFPLVNSIPLKIIYLDERSTTEFIFSRDQLPKLSNQISGMINSPWQKVEENCQHCDYQKICQVKLINC